MAKPAQFEEKTYEQHLTVELLHGRRLFFPPGQVLEGVIGFDVALSTSDRTFWKLFPPMSPWWRRFFSMHPPGMRLSNRWWKELEDEIEHFPKFKFNCFVQAKRPTRMVGSTASEYSSWKKSYFRYDTFSSQQLALESLSQKTMGKAIVVYACPAFHTLDELWRAISSGQLVKQSNFCEVAKLKGHGRYSYITAGNLGVAHSEPVTIESVPFDQALDALQNQPPAQSNAAFLINTAETIVGASAQLVELRETFTLLAATIFQEADSGFARALATIYAFQLTCNVQLLIGCES